MGADCKSAGVSLRRFESFSLHHFAGIAQLVEHQPSKLNVAGSNPVSRSIFQAVIAQLVEHVLGKDEVASSILVDSSKIVLLCCYYYYVFGAEFYRSLAQLVEHRSPKPGVGGSIPSWPATNWRP